MRGVGEGALKLLEESGLEVEAPADSVMAPHAVCLPITIIIVIIILIVIMILIVITIAILLPIVIIYWYSNN